ncbi:mucin-22-like isoform X1 [Branchiostoma lanceolatum]|uniref:mucin-22-like isoform X1 n=1 Tax=Branchiostoma lanceolatum TaxID=7740 RepID=UPI0034522304
MGNTAPNTSMDPTTQTDGNTTVVTTRRMTTAGASGSTETTAAPNTTQPATSTMMNATSQATTAAMNTTATMQSTTGAMNTTATMQGTTGAMNTTATMQATSTMNTTAEMQGTTGGMNTTGAMNTTAMPGTTGGMNTTGAMNTTTMPGTTDTMNTTAEIQGSAGGMNTTATMPGTTGAMNTTAMPDTTATMNTTPTQGIGEMNTTATMQGTTGGMNTTAGTPEATGTTASDNATMAPMNTTMMATTQTTTQTTAAMATTAPGPYTWNVTFDANCTVALNNEMEFLQNCSVAVADWLNVSENTTRCRNITCGSTNVIVEVDPPAYQQAVADKFASLNEPDPAEPLFLSFGGTNFTATGAEAINVPLQSTAAPGTTLKSPTNTKPTPLGFCMFGGLDHTGCIIFVCGVGACGLILFVTVVVCVVRCCRRQKSKSFDLLSDIPHISLSDYPMTTIPRPSVYQPGNNSGQVNMAYITDDDPDKPKQPLESSNTSQSSHSSGRTEDEKSTNAQTDNHVQQEVASASYQPVATEEQPPPVYSPQSGTNNVVQPTGTDQAPGPYHSPASPVKEDLLDIPEIVDNSEVPESENPTISFREAPDTPDDPESPAPASPVVIKGDDGSVSVVVNW